jgi:GNAT superfamily N-acetyltransferase
LTVYDRSADPQKKIRNRQVEDLPRISMAELYIRGMAVQPSARGLHLGELLLTCIEHFAFGQGFERMFLSTTPFLNHAIRLYEGFGFKRTGEGPYDLHGPPLFTMQKLLPLNS